MNRIYDIIKINKKYINNIKKGLFQVYSTAFLLLTIIVNLLQGSNFLNNQFAHRRVSVYSLKV